MRAIVTTTINPPTPALEAFARKKDWKLYVVADQKTPCDLYQDKRYGLISVESQQDRFPGLSNMLGWNCIQRRNIGYIWAYLDGADVIASVDDDVIPYEGWGDDLLIGKNKTLPQYDAANGVFDPLVSGPYWHRGYPPELLASRQEYIVSETEVVPDVQVGLWDGKPDIDAMCRLIHNDPVIRLPELEFTTNSVAIFNSQNTFFNRAAMPFYFLFPVDRMDDIWGGIVLQQNFAAQIVYTKPSVYHMRNNHDLYGDVMREVRWLKDTVRVVGGWLPEKCKEAYEQYQRYFK